MLVKDELARIHRDGMLPAGVILTGGAVKIAGVTDLARETLNLPVQIGFPQNYEGVVDKIDDPSYATAIGLLIWGSKFEGRPHGAKAINFKKGMGSIKKWFKGLIP